VVPSLRGLPFNNMNLEQKGCEWIAPNAVTIGDVQIGENSSIWHGVIIRGDTAKVSIGKNVIIQDLTTLVTEELNPTIAKEKELQKENEGKIVIKDNVVIGPNCIINKAVLESNCFVATKCVVSDGCTIESYAVLAGGSYLEPGKTVPSGQVWAGNPAKYLRDLTIEEKIAMVENLKQLSELGKIYSEETEKSARQVLTDKYEHYADSQEAWQYNMEYKLWLKGYPLTEEDHYYLEHRTNFDGSDKFLAEKDNMTKYHEKDAYDRSWEPLSYDADKMSSVLKKYGVNTEMYEKAYQRFKNEPKNIERNDESIGDKIPKDKTPWEEKYDNSRRQNPPTIS